MEVIRKAIAKSESRYSKSSSRITIILTRALQVGFLSLSDENAEVDNQPTDSGDKGGMK